MREAPRVCGKFDKSHQTVTPGNRCFDCDGSCVGPMKNKGNEIEAFTTWVGVGGGG